MIFQDTIDSGHDTIARLNDFQDTIDSLHHFIQDANDIRHHVFQDTNHFRTLLTSGQCVQNWTDLLGLVYLFWTRYSAAETKSSNTFCLFPNIPPLCQLSPYSLYRAHPLTPHVHTLMCTHTHCHTYTHIETHTHIHTHKHE